MSTVKRLSVSDPVLTVKTFCDEEKEDVIAYILSSVESDVVPLISTVFSLTAMVLVSVLCVPDRKMIGRESCSVSDARMKAE